MKKMIILIQQQKMVKNIKRNKLWQVWLNNSKASRIVTFIKGLNFDDHSNYNDLMNKTIDLAVLMRGTFKNYIN